MLSELCDVLRNMFENWNSIHERVFSVIIYCILRLFSIKYKLISECLDNLNCVSVKRVHPWALTLFEENDCSVILKDLRGGYRNEPFYDMYPDLELKAKDFSLIETSKKSSLFSVQILAE
jgi:hypothetical protein